MNWHMHPCSPLPGHCLPQPMLFFYPVFVPMPAQSPEPECHHEHDECKCECEVLRVPQQIDATGDETPSAVLVGGDDEVCLTVEYLVEADATDAKVTVTAVQADGATQDWSDAAPATGFHVQSNIMTVPPGTKLTLTINAVTARLRWCETICC